MGDQKAEIKALLAKAKQQDFSVQRTNGGHFHVERDGHLVAVVSSSPSAQGAAKAVKADLVKAGFQTEGERVRNEVMEDGGDEGRLLLCLSESDRAKSAYTLSRECGLPIGTVNFVLRGALGRFPNLHYENELWAWDPTEGTDLAQPSTEDLTTATANTEAQDVNVTSGDGGITNVTGAKAEESTGARMGLAPGWSLVGSYVVDPRADPRRADEAGVWPHAVEAADVNPNKSLLPDNDGGNANLNGATVRRNVPYRDATVAKEPGANLAGANLTGVNLKDANLAGANLKDANLAGANLAGANLAGVNLKDANLAGANLTGVNLKDANLAGVDLSHANLAGADLSHANLAGANLSGGKARGADLGAAGLLWNTGREGSESDGEAICGL